jgi:hypothetical protein
MSRQKESTPSSVSIKTKAVAVISHGEGIPLCLSAIPNAPVIHKAEILLCEKCVAPIRIRKKELKCISLLILVTEVFF